MQEGLTIALYTPRLTNYLLVGAIRGQRQKNGYPFDKDKKVHRLNDRIVVAEHQKSTYKTITGTVRTVDVINELKKRLPPSSSVNEAAHSLFPLLYNRIIRNLDFMAELEENHNALLLALEPRYGVTPTRTIRNDNDQTIEVEGVTTRDFKTPGGIIPRGRIIRTCVALPELIVMVAGLDIKGDKIIPDVYRVECSTQGVRAAKIIQYKGPDCSIAGYQGGEITPDKVALKLLDDLHKANSPLSLEEATSMLSNCMTTGAREILKLPTTHDIPTDIEVIRPPM